MASTSDRNFKATSDAPGSPRLSRRVKRTGNLQEERDNIARDIVTHIIEATPSDFLNNYTDQSKWDSKIQDCISKLKISPPTHQNLDPLLDEGGRWNMHIFPDIEPGQAAEKENQFYRRLCVVSEAICSWAEEELSLVETAHFSCRPNNSTESEIHGSSFHSDAMWVRSDYVGPRAASHQLPQKHVPSSAVVANGEWKLRRKDAVDNRKKAMGAAAHYLNNDPTRWHFYSITVEAYDVTLWYYSRSHCVKTTVFNLKE
ncbi:hypothetical protein K435DRAFT_814588, partial [Dendrothele bispora CBS 962.96]